MFFESIPTLLNGIKHSIEKKIEKPIKNAEEGQFFIFEAGKPKWKSFKIAEKVSDLENDLDFTPKTYVDSGDDEIKSFMMEGTSEDCKLINESVVEEGTGISNPLVSTSHLNGELDNLHDDISFYRDDLLGRLMDGTTSHNQAINENYLNSLMSDGTSTENKLVNKSYLIDGTTEENPAVNKSYVENLFPVIEITTYPEATVTAVHDDLTLTGTADEDGKIIFRPIFDFGGWILTSAFDGISKTVNITIDAVQKYEALIKYPAIEVTTYPGSTVTAVLDDTTLTEIADENGIALFKYITTNGEWLLASTFGEFVKSASVDVENDQQYGITIKNTPSVTVITSPGSTVTAVLDDTTLTEIADENGIAFFEHILSYGNWTLTSVIETYSKSDSLSINAVQNYDITINNVPIYGVEWGRTSSPVWTRTDDAALFADPVPYVLRMQEGAWGSPFDNLMPWAGMVKVEDEEAGTLVAIPKFYYKWDNDETKMKLQISPKPQDGFHTSPAHVDRGDGKGERDIVYIGRYHCSESDYKSRSKKPPKVAITRAQARTAIASLGNNIWQLDHAMWWTINMLYLVEYANANCQNTIAYGRGYEYTGATATMGYTDSLPYHTGTSISSKTTYATSTQYRNIEGLWDNCWDWCDGIYFIGTNIYHILNPLQFSDNSNGTFTGTRAESGGLITGFTFPTITNYEWAGYPAPSDISSSSDYGSYFCDVSLNSDSTAALLVGGDYYGTQVINNGAKCGLFFRRGDLASATPAANIGCRLQKLP